MLQEMRTAVSSLWIKILLGALVVSFVSFYGFRGDRGLSPGIVATVDGESIREHDVAIRFHNMIEYYRRMGLIQNDLPDTLVSSMRQQVVAQMIDQKLKEKQAVKAGLRVSPQQVRETIEKQFSDAKGTFDFEFYRNYLRSRLGKTTGEYESEEARAKLAAEYDRLLEQTAFTSSEELKLLYQAKNDKVSLAFVRLDPDKLPRNFPKIAAPNENELKSHLDGHAAAYQIPEARKLEIVWYSWSDFEKPTDAELNMLLQKKFPSEKDAAATGERIHAAHILLRAGENNDAEIRKRAEEIYTRIRKGADFARTARAESEDGSRTQGGDLGYFGRGAMVKEFEAKALTLKPGEISPPFRTQFGYHIVKLIGKIPAGPRTPERLKPELVSEWEKETLAKPARLEKFMKDAEQLLATFKASVGKATLAEAKKDPRLHQTRTDFVSTDGSIPDLSEDSSDIIRKAQTLAAGNLSEPIRLAANGRVALVRVEAVRPARLPALAEVRSRVAEDLMKARREDALRNYSKDLLAKWVSSSKPIETLAKEDGLPVEETGEFARANDNRVPKIGPSPVVMTEAFTRTEKQPFVSEPVASGRAWVLVALKKRTPPDWTLFDSEREGLRGATIGEASKNRMRDWVAYLRKNAKITQLGPAESNDGSTAPDLPLDE